LFFGQKYNSVVIGANGQVGFDAATQAGAFNAWASSGFVAPNNNAAMNNTIMTPYHDVNPAVAYAGKNITWDIYGTAPCRYMVVSWDSVPMFSCSTLLASQQVVLFESTYLMDINIKQKPLCSTWNGGVAHEGIQNANGTVAFMVPGRNGTQWTATNDSYRFTPSGTINVNFQYWWIDIPTGDTLGTGPTLSYFPTQSSQVTVACYAVTDCDTIQAFYGDTVNVIVTGQVIADFSSEIHLGCDEDTVIFKNLSTSTAGGTPSYLWSFGDGSISTSFDTTHIYANQGIFPVILIASDNGCYDTIVKPLDLLHPINADFKVSDGTHVDSTCLGLPLIFNASGFLPQELVF
jgi:PKD repeat protein